MSPLQGLLWSGGWVGLGPCESMMGWVGLGNVKGLMSISGLSSVCVLFECVRRLRQEVPRVQGGDDRRQLRRDERSAVEDWRRACRRAGQHGSAYPVDLQAILIARTQPRTSSTANRHQLR